MNSASPVARSRTPKTTDPPYRSPLDRRPWSTFVLLTSLAAMDGNILLLSATGALYSPEVAVVSAFFSVAGAGAWSLATQFWSAESRRADARCRREFWATALISSALTVLASAGGAALAGTLQVRVLRYFGAAAIGLVAAAILLQKPILGLPFGSRRIPLPTALVVLGILSEVALFLRSHEPVHGLSLNAAVRGAIAGVVVAAMAWASILAFCKVPAHRALNRPTFGFFGGVTLAMIAGYVAGFSPGSHVFVQPLAQYAVLAVFAIGVVLSALVRRWTGHSGWPQEASANSPAPPPPSPGPSPPTHSRPPTLIPAAASSE